MKKNLVLVLAFLQHAFMMLINKNVTNLNKTQGFAIFGSIQDDISGHSVSGAGDINGDGIQDIIIGAYEANPFGRSNAGAAFVIFGRRNGSFDLDLNTSLTNNSLGFKISGAAQNDNFAFSVSEAGDINADGIDDIIIGAFLADPLGRNGAGAAYVIYGRRNVSVNIDLNTDLVNNTLGFRIIGAISKDYFGRSVNCAGDINGDGIDDVIIGASKASPFNREEAGAAFVIYGRINGYADIDLNTSLSNNTIGFKISGGNASNWVGFSVNGAGDFNGDGIGDIVLGAHQADPFNRNQSGAAYLIYGKQGIRSDIDLNNTLDNNTLGFKISGSMRYDYLGRSVSSAGDVNGDGLDDIIVGAYQADPFGRINAGEAYVIYGRQNGTVDIDLNSSLTANGIGFKISGDIQGDTFGRSVSSAGDINGDGVDDIIIGANSANPFNISNAGAAYVIYGNKSGLLDIDLNKSFINDTGLGIKISGAAVNDSLGISVSGVGDVNGDGVDDIIVGAYLSDPLGRSDAGTSYVVYGVKTIFPNSSGTNKITNEEVISPTFSEISSAIASASQSVNIAASIISFIQFADPGTIFFNTYLNVLMYIKYLNITCPPRLKYILNQSQGNIFTIPFLENGLDQLKEKLPTSELSKSFEKANLHSSFLINFWYPLLMLSIIFGFIALTNILEFFTRKSDGLNKFFAKLKTVFMWNYLLNVFTELYGDVSLYTSLDMRTNHFANFLEWLSFSLCILMNIMALSFVFRMIMVVRKLSQAKEYSKSIQNSDHLKKVEQQLAGYEVVFGKFKNNSFLHQGFSIFFSVRFYLFYSVLGYLFEYPFFQVVLINMIGASMLIYLIIIRPPKSKIDMLQYLTQEIIFQVVHSFTLALVVLDIYSPDDTANREIFGDIIIWSYAALVIFGVIYFSINLLVILKDLFSYLRDKVTKKNSKSPMVDISRVERLSQNKGLFHNSQSISTGQEETINMETSLNMTNNVLSENEPFSVKSKRSFGNPRRSLDYQNNNLESIKSLRRNTFRPSNYQNEKNLKFTYTKEEYGTKMTNIEASMKNSESTETLRTMASRKDFKK